MSGSSLKISDNLPVVGMDCTYQTYLAKSEFPIISFLTMTEFQLH